MLPKKKRVTKTVFQSTLKEGKMFSTSLFLFYFKQNKTPQCAFVAPKNIFKKAVERNKFRRIGYNIIRDIPLKNSIGLFIYKKQAKNTPINEIKENIFFILKKTNLL